jgi:hypothetical protein
MTQWQADEALRKIVVKEQSNEAKKLFKQGKFDESHQIAASLQQAQPPQGSADGLNEKCYENSRGRSHLRS